MIAECFDNKVGFKANELLLISKLAMLEQEAKEECRNNKLLSLLLQSERHLDNPTLRICQIFCKTRSLSTLSFNNPVVSEATNWDSFFLSNFANGHV